MTLCFEKKIILITGATRGLGLELAKQFWRLGGNLILVGRDEGLLAGLHNALLENKQHPFQKATALTVNLAQPSEVENLILQLPYIDVLVNNAAIQGPIGPFWENETDQWHATLQVNLLAPITLCRAVLPHMIENSSGKIINISGGGSTQPRPNFSAYATAKTGLVRFSETLAEEISQYNIDVNCVIPGTMNTHTLVEIMLAGDQAGETEFSQVQKRCETENSTMQDAVDLCLFLASPDSNGITGKLLSAWDPWKNFGKYIEEMKNSDVYSLKRIVPKDRNFDWDN